ncbi:HAAS signaling domain-containing protein [Staphylococcus pasteuri]|uniref:HAAS signaling domain-containing protein n=1 Tax=Staphylococcus pasteuri TaxID=45972 RepID=UPI003787E746
MDKITFLNELEVSLDELPKKEKDKKMFDYEHYFYEEELKGKSEAEIVKELKEPEDIAKQVKASSAIEYAEVKPTFHNIIRAVTASLSLGLLSIFLVLIPVFLIFMPLILVISSIYKGIHDSTSNILFSIAYSGLGLMLIVLTFKVLEGIYRLILKYLKWYIKTIKGRVQR